MRDYLGDSGGRVYQTPAEAAEIVRSTASWSASESRGLSRRASAFAARHYSMRVVAPRLVAEWRRVLEERAPVPLPVRGWWRRLGGRAKVAAWAAPRRVALATRDRVRRTAADRRRRLVSHRSSGRLVRARTQRSRWNR